MQSVVQVTFCISSASHAVYFVYNADVMYVTVTAAAMLCSIAHLGSSFTFANYNGCWDDHSTSSRRCHRLISRCIITFTVNS